MNYFGFPLTNKFRSKTPKGFYDAVKGHSGIDVIMPVGTPLSLPIKGIVLKYRKQTEMGWCLYIQEPNGNIHVLAHLSESKVREGEQVSETQIVALSGNTGSKSTAPHAHYEIIAPSPKEGLEFMTRELSPYKGWNIDPEEYLQNIGPELTDLEWCQKHLPEADWEKISSEIATAFRSLAKRVEWRK